MKSLRGAQALCVLAVALLSLAPFSRAQDAPALLAEVNAGDVHALAISGDGRRLFATDSDAGALVVYSLETRSLLETLGTVALEGSPTALSAAHDFALVTVDGGSEGDALESVGPDPFTGDYTPLNIVDIPNGSAFLSAASDGRWALLIGEGWYSLVQIVSATDMIAYPSTSRAAPQSGALGASIAFITQDSPAAVVQYLLRSNRSPRPARTLNLDETPGLLTLNARMSVGAVISGGREIILFDTATLQLLSRVPVDAGRPTQMAFSAREDGEWLLVATEGSQDVRLLDVSNPQSIGEIGSFTLDIIPTHMLLIDDRLVVSDGSTIQVYQGF